jgi:hypothetical protein
MKIGKSDLRELVREVIREELNTRKYFKESVNVLDVSASEVDDLARDVYVDAEFDSAYETDRRTVGETVKALVVDVISSEYPNMDLGNVPDRVISALKNMLETGVLTESSLTAEEKIDAWHAGTRRENYKAAGIPKLQTFLDIAKRKGYTEIVNIIEGELVRRGVTPSASAPIATTSSASTASAAASTMPWEDLIEKADELLDELCIESDNTFWDDGDGYWSSDVGSEWTMRNIYHADTLTNVDELKKLCDEYSKKLPNVTFYYCEDEPVSEIGYTAVNVDYKSA